MPYETLIAETPYNNALVFDTMGLSSMMYLSVCTHVMNFASIERSLVS